MIAVTKRSFVLTLELTDLEVKLLRDYISAVGTLSQRVEQGTYNTPVGDTARALYGVLSASLKGGA